MNRREALMVPVGLAFAASGIGCAEVEAELPQWSQDATTIANALSTIGGAVASIQGLPSAVASDISTAIASAKSLAESLASSVASGASSTAMGITNLITQFGSTVTSAVSSIGNLTVPSWVTTALGAIQTVLPTILSVAGIALAPAAAASGLTVDQARAILKALSA